MFYQRDLSLREINEFNTSTEFTTKLWISKGFSEWLWSGLLNSSLYRRALFFFSQVLWLKWNTIAQLLHDVKSGDKNIGSQLPRIWPCLIAGCCQLHLTYLLQLLCWRKPWWYQQQPRPARFGTLNSRPWFASTIVRGTYSVIIEAKLQIHWATLL